MNATVLKWAQLMAMEDRLVEKIREASACRDFYRAEELRAQREGILKALGRIGWRREQRRRK